MADTKPESAAAQAWATALRDWRIPEHILAHAPESPWGFSVEVFTSRADGALSQWTPSNQRAIEALPEAGVVLDVGCGAGAASLPLASRASRLIGVDQSAGMLEAFLERAGRAGVEAEAIEGAWPDIADVTPHADVVVCHHVVYNALDLPTFARRLTDHARRRVVIELTRSHPLAPMNELWRRFHGLARPDRPTADDAEAVLRELALDPHREDWTAPRPGGFPTKDVLVAQVRRQLCLTAERDAEIAEAIAARIVERDGLFGFPDRPVATIWWNPTPPRP